VGKLLESALIAQYKDIEKELLSLNFSSYESAVYISLLGKNQAVNVKDITQTCKSLGREVPVTKIYTVLNNLDQKGLVEKTDRPLRYSIRFGKNHLANYVQQQMKEKEDRIQKEKSEAVNNLDRIWKDYLGKIRKNYDIWRIYSKNEAKELSLSMCKNATQEIRLMTEHGGWIHNDPEFRNVLIDRAQDKNFKIWALIANKKSVKEGRNDEWNAFRIFLDKYKIRYYFYEPGALRMTIADKKESLFFMYRDQGQKEDPIIYYTALPDVSLSLSGFFNMECLFEYQSKLKSFIESSTKDQKFCDLQNLLFD